MPFLSCFNTSTIRPAPLLTKIDAAGQAGFRAIELWNDDITAFVQYGGGTDEIRARLHANQLTVPSVIAILGWIGGPDTEREAARREAIRRIEQARLMGSPYIVCTPPRGEVDMARAGRDYAELMLIGRDQGVLPAMEFLGFVEQVNGIPTAWEIVERAGDPEGTLVVDWFHMVRGQSTTLEDLRRLPADRIAIVHLDDVPYDKPFSEMSDADRVYPGDGEIPLDEFFAVLEEIGYRGAVSLELFNRELWEQDPFQVAKTGYEKSSRWIE